MQSCFILSDRIVDKFHCAKQIDHCTNNLGEEEERGGKEWDMRGEVGEGRGGGGGREEGEEEGGEGREGGEERDGRGREGG